MKFLLPWHIHISHGVKSATICNIRQGLCSIYNVSTFIGRLQCVRPCAGLSRQDGCFSPTPASCYLGLSYPPCKTFSLSLLPCWPAKLLACPADHSRCPLPLGLCCTSTSARHLLQHLRPTTLPSASSQEPALLSCCQVYLECLSPRCHCLCLPLGSRQVRVTAHLCTLWLPTMSFCVLCFLICIHLSTPAVLSLWITTLLGGKVE